MLMVNGEGRRGERAGRDVAAALLVAAIAGDDDCTPVVRQPEQRQIIFRDSFLTLLQSSIVDTA